MIADGQTSVAVLPIEPRATSTLCRFDRAETDGISRTEHYPEGEQIKQEKNEIQTWSTEVSSSLIHECSTCEMMEYTNSGFFLPNLVCTEGWLRTTGPIKSPESGSHIWGCNQTIHPFIWKS